MSNSFGGRPGTSFARGASTPPPRNFASQQCTVHHRNPNAAATSSGCALNLSHRTYPHPLQRRMVNPAAVILRYAKAPPQAHTGVQPLTIFLGSRGLHVFSREPDT